MNMRLPLLILVVAALSGCSKNDDTVDTTDYGAPFIGRWQVSTGGNGMKYAIFTTDRAAYLLGEDTHGFRGVLSGTFSANSTTATIAANDYLYAITADQLSLLGGGDTITLARTTNAPDPTAWVRPVTPDDSIPAPVNQAVDIGCDSVSLWMGSGLAGDATLYRIDRATRAVMPLVPPLLVTGVEWTGSELWCSGAFASTLSRLNPVNGALISSSGTVGGNIYGLAWDGTVLWAGSQSAGALLAYDPSLNSVVQSVAGIVGDGMAFAGGFLYLCKSGSIYKCTLSPFQVVTSWSIPGRKAYGIAFDGTHFWVSATAGGQPPITFTIYRVTL